MGIPILFDTDPGIDDAMALLMLAHDPRASLVGISTVFGNASIETTTANALALCERFGIEVPVARGAARALALPPRDFPVEIHGRDGIGDAGLQPARRWRAEARPAAEFIAAKSHEHGGELVLLAVGPLTNLALALQHDPTIVQRVRRVVVMGGAFGTLGHHGNVTPHAEANIHCDPHAAAAVLGADWEVTMVGLDVTHEVVMRTDYLDALGRDGGEAGRFMRDITRLYEACYQRRTGGGICSHDASAAACALDPSAFRINAGTVQVATEGALLGQTRMQPAAAQPPDAPTAAAQRGLSAPRHTVCVDVDAPRLLDEFRALFAAPAASARPG